MRKRILFIFLLVLCLCAVPVSAAALGKVSGVKAKQSGEKVKVTWNTAAGAKGYQVYQKTGSEKFHRIKSTGKKSYTVSGLTPGNTYYFRVRAYADSSGKKKYGKYSSSVKITIKNSSAAEGKVITVSPKSDTYKKKYMNTSWFTEQTRSYYVLRSYLEYFAKSEVKVWECRNCGHIVIGEKAPEICPTCNHPQSYFEIHAENY